MPKFRKREVLIDAFQVITVGSGGPIEPGDWIIQDEDGNLTVCKAMEFENKYEPVEE